MRAIMNACGHECHDRPDGHDCGFLNCQRVHVREREHGCVHDYEHSWNRDYVDEYVGADDRASRSWCPRTLR